MTKDNGLLEVRILFRDLSEDDTAGMFKLEKGKTFQSAGRIIIPKQKIGDVEIKSSAVFFQSIDQLQDKLSRLMEKSKLTLIEIKALA